MRGLFTKIFLCFWIAQSLTLVISTGYILRHRFARPDQFGDAFNASYMSVAESALRAYEESGCPALAHYQQSIGQSLYLVDESSRFVCSADSVAPYAAAIAEIAHKPDIQSMEAGGHLVWGKPISDGKGRTFTYLLVRPLTVRQGGWWEDIQHFAFPQVPVAIFVFGASTFFLVLMLTRPIAQLRAAAGSLAKGQLNARVPQSGREISLFGVDEIQGLVHDFNFMAERLESLMSAQQILLRDVSHELRTPLTRLSVTLELAREDAPSFMTEYLARIEHEAACVASLIEQLLRLSSMESANELVRTEVFSFRTLVDEIASNADFEAQRRSCGVVVDDVCDCMVEGVPGLVHQAVENIVRNAIRYTREESIVELTLRHEGPQLQGAVVLEVSDEGPGIPEHEMEKIFLPFYRVDGARQRNTGGFGVGLAIAERAIKLHHGTISARNRPGGGLTVTIRIPCRHRASEPSRTVSPQPLASGAA